MKQYGAIRSGALWYIRDHREPQLWFPGAGLVRGGDNRLRSFRTQKAAERAARKLNKSTSSNPQTKVA